MACIYGDELLPYYSVCTEIIWFNSFLNGFQVLMFCVPNAPPNIMMTIFRHCPFPSFPQKMKDPDVLRARTIW